MLIKKQYSLSGNTMELKTKNYIVVHTIDMYGENDYATLSVIQLVPKFSI